MVRAVHLGRLTSHVRDVRKLLGVRTPSQPEQLAHLLRGGTAMCKRWTNSCRLEGWWATPRADTSMLAHHVEYTSEIVLLIKSALPHLSSALLFEFVSCSGVVLSMWPPSWPNSHVLCNPGLLHQLDALLVWLSDAVRTGVPLAQDTVEADIWLLTVSLGAAAPPGYLQRLCSLACTALSPAVNSFQYKPNSLMGLAHGFGLHSPATMILPQLLHLIQHTSIQNRHNVAALIITMTGSVPRSPTCESMLRVALSIYTPILQDSFTAQAPLRIPMLIRCIRKYPVLMRQCVACMTAAWQSSNTIDACHLCLHSTLVNFRNSTLDAGLRPLLYGVLETLRAGLLPPNIVPRLRTVCGMPGMLAAWEAIMRWDSQVMNLPVMSLSILQAARLLAAAATSLPVDNSQGRSVRMSSMSVTMMKLLRKCSVQADPAQSQVQTAQQAETAQLLLTVFRHMSRGLIQNTLHILKARISLALVMVEMLSHAHLPQAIRLAVRTATFTVPCLYDKTEWLHNLLPSMHGRVLSGCCFLHCGNLEGASEAALKTSLCSGCRCSRYCSVECQKADWDGDHKLVCGKGKWTPAAASAIAAAREAAREVMHHALRAAMESEVMAVASLKVVQAALVDAEAVEAHAISTIEETKVMLSHADVAASVADAAAAKAEASLDASNSARALAKAAADAADAAEALAAVDLSAAAVVLQAAKLARARADAVIDATRAAVLATRVMVRDLAAKATLAAAAARASSTTSRAAMVAAREAGVM